MQEVFRVGGVEVLPGTRAAIDLPITDLSTHTPITMPVVVVHGKRPGPRLFVCAALHGDEINGVEIIRRLLQLSALKRLRGTLIAVPVVNVPGFLSIDIKQFGGDIANLADRALARLGPLIASQSMQPSSQWQAWHCNARVFGATTAARGGRV